MKTLDGLFESAEAVLIRKRVLRLLATDIAGSAKSKLAHAESLRKTAEGVTDIEQRLRLLLLARKVEADGMLHTEWARELTEWLGGHGQVSSKNAPRV